jgi:hypothetical protein
MGGLASLLLALLIVLILLQNLPTILRMGVTNLSAIGLVIVVSLALGHLFGGPTKATRAPLALTAAYRNGALALLVGTTAFVRSVPYIAAYEAVALACCTVYLVWVLWRAKPTVGARS